MMPTVAGLAAIGVAAAVWGTLVERRWYALRAADVPALDGEGPPLRILHLSDLHLLPWQAHKRQFVDHCRRTEPDLVVLTGDILGHPDAVGPAVELLGRFAPPAVAVLGSNDFTAPTPRNPLGYLTGPSEVPGDHVRLDTARLVAGLREHGWLVLENERVPVTTKGGIIDVIGLGDPHINRDQPERIDESTAPPDARLRLGVVHAPYRRALDALAGHDCRLLLAGHTHGGQVRLPGIGALVTNCDLPTAQARGLSRHREAFLHVSAGLGTSMYAPVRFACRPEATLLHVSPRR